MDDAEYVVVLHKRTKVVNCTHASTWDQLTQNIREYEQKWGKPWNEHLTLLARGLTREQAEGMVKLTEENEE